MQGLKGFVAGALLSASFLMATTANAMPIPQYDKMTNQQQAEYDTFLVRSAANILIAQGDTADADKVIKLFEGKPGETSPPTAIQYVRNLNGVRNLNQQHASDPNFKPYEVEHALMLTLKQQGIIVPISKLLQVGLTFKPTPPSGRLTAQNGAPQPPVHPGQ